MNKNSKNKDYKIGTVLVFLAAVSFAFKGILAKLCYKENIDIETLLFLRFLIATPFFFIIPKIISQSISPSKTLKNNFVHVFISSVLFFISTVADFKALSLIQVSIERVILFSYPLFIIIINALLTKKAPTPIYFIVFVVVEMGVAMTVGFFSNIKILTSNIEGSLWALGAAISYSIYLVMSQRIIQRMGSISFTVISNLIVLIFITIYFLLTREINSIIISGKGLLYVSLIAIFCTAVPFFMVYEGIRRIGAPRAGLISMSGPAITLFAAYVLLGERLSLLQLIGALVILTGIAILESNQCKN